MLEVIRGKTGCARLQWSFWNTYSYDANGNLTRKNDGANNFDYFYDDTNRLTRYDAPGADNNASYLYDESWRWVTTTVGGTTTVFLYDGADVVGREKANKMISALYLPSQ